MNSDRRSFFFGATLSEIGFILFFALLIFAFFKQQEDQNKIDDTVNRLEIVLKEIEVRSAALAELEKAVSFNSEEERDKYFSELIPRSELSVRNVELESQVVELRDRLEELHKIELAIDEMANSHDSTEEEIRSALELRDALSQLTGAKEEISSEVLSAALDAQMAINEFNAGSSEPIRDAEDLANKLSRIGDLEGQVKNLRGRLGGRDLPPCWADRDTGKIEYLFDVIISDDGLRFASAAPIYRLQEFQLLPNTKEMTAELISLGRFEVLADPILEISDQKQCRHYVSITDRSENAYKTTLTIEDYFYKFVNRT